MADLTIGRIGLQDVDLDRVEQMKEVNDARQGRAIRVKGHLRASSLAETNYLRDSLMTIRPGSLIPITHTTDTEIDGFYRFGWASVELAAEDAALNDPGYMSFEFVAYRLGEENDIWFQSRLTGTVRSNDIGLIESEVTPILAPPTGFSNWWQGSTENYHAVASRETTDGSTMSFFYDTDLYTGANPRWSASPSDYYNGAVTLEAEGYLRPGLSIPNDTTGWVLGNSLVKIGGKSNGYFDFHCWDGTQWDTAQTIGLTYDTSSGIVSSWDTIACLRNDPHAVVVRLMGAWQGSTQRKTHVVDITLRRGARHVEFRSNRGGSAQSAMLMRHSTDWTGNGTVFTPTGASAAIGLLSGSIDQNRYLMMTPSGSSATWSTSAGIIGTTDVRSQSFAYGAVVNSASPGTANDSTAIALQYMGSIAEEVRAVYR
jgi:hypothetical protein